jgi:two-component system NarL family response regulator
MASGASWWDATATEVICATVLGDSPPASSPSLTPREREILQLLHQGKSNQEIAQQLYISPGTVRVHVHAIVILSKNATEIDLQRPSLQHSRCLTVN